MYIKDKKVIISAAITGATHVPSLSAHLPKNPDEIIQSALEAHKAGAAVIHIHARDEEGKPTTDHGIFRYILSSIARECDAVIGITTGGANGMSVEERFSVIEKFRPEMASANAGSMNFCYNRLLADVDETVYDWEREYVERTWDNVFRNSFRDMEYCIRTMNDLSLIHIWVDAGLMGSENALGAKIKGARGFVMNGGGIRDTDEVIKEEIPVWSYFVSQKMDQVRIRYDAKDIPVSIGGVVICPGDIIVADGDGVIAVPRKIAKDVAKYAHRELFNDKNARREKYEKLGWELDESVVNNQVKYEG